MEQLAQWGAVVLRRARSTDLPAIVALLADDVLGSTREATGDQELTAYERAFDAIDADPAHLLVVAEADGRLVGTMQLSFVPGLASRGALRGQIEAVRVASWRRGDRLGSSMIDWAIRECRARGCAMVQLTSDKRRPDAHRFYERLGFAATHEGFKLPL
ncbi:GNAT family N-acetyltransferase [Pseudonocardia spinosispora]|uniref:GNAT family N-acetyltransferase n=1 Tax=Pseudonocardia spinosispora TaxID=103441 RepID=UPI000418ECF0|nr:GNAT family N-acetyltransferase [Pseudonocardia spinosispora]